MSNLQAMRIASRFDALHGEFTNAAMMRDYDRFA